MDTTYNIWCSTLPSLNSSIANLFVIAVPGPEARREVGDQNTAAVAAAAGLGPDPGLGGSLAGGGIGQGSIEKLLSFSII